MQNAVLKKNSYPLAISFATHLLERGLSLRHIQALFSFWIIGFRTFNNLSLRHIQALLGHARPETTARYAHLTGITEKETRSTINDLMNTLHVDLKKV